MNMTQNTPMVCYKFRFPVVSQQWQLEGELDRTFIQDYGQQISDQWTLIDPIGNSHIVHYNMNTEKPRLTYGWHRLRYFYNLQGDSVFTLDYVGGSVFQIQIRDQQRKEVHYGSFGEPANRVAGVIQPQNANPQPAAIEEADNNPEDYQCVFTYVLNFHQATGDTMRVPPSVGEYLKGAGVDSWWFIGCSNVEIECKIIKSEKSDYVAIGEGWKNFCAVNYVLPLEEYIFKFTNPETRVVHVSLKQDL